MPENRADRCPKCKALGKVVSKRIGADFSVRRRRECIFGCMRWTTLEEAAPLTEVAKRPKD